MAYRRNNMYSGLYLKDVWTNLNMVVQVSVPRHTLLHPYLLHHYARIRRSFASFHSHLIAPAVSKYKGFGICMSQKG